MDIYYKHYILIDNRNRTIDGWSDGPRFDKDIFGAICINEQGGYQFAMDGVENPPLLTMEGVPLYAWDGKQIVKRSEADVQADIEALPKPEPQPDYAAFLKGLMEGSQI